MDKKKILIIVGVVAVVGIGLYMWNKSKKSATEDGGDAQAKGESADAQNKSAEAPTSESTSSKAPLTTRKAKKKACGRKPLNKKKRAEWQKCVDAGGTASFEGDFDDFQHDYIDFQGSQVDNQFMFSEFENSLDLDL